MNLRKRIALTFIGLTAIGVAIVSLMVSWQFGDYLDQKSTDEVYEKVDAIAMLFDRGSLRIDSAGHAGEEMDRLARTLDLRITLIRKDGQVLYDSSVDADSLVSLENHGQRPEIVRARRGTRGSDRRRSATRGEEYLYAARVVTTPLPSPLDSVYVRGAYRLTEIGAMDRQVRFMVVGVGLLGILITALVSFRVAQRITRPVLEIADAAYEIKNGNLARRSEVVRDDEIGKLSVAINGMAEKLSNDITRLKKLEQMRSEFLGNVSHELRTPAFSIQGFLETLLDGAIDDPAVNRDFLEKAYRHTARLNALLNDLIEISRIETGEMKMSFRYFSLAEFLQQSIADLCPEAEKKQISLTLNTALGKEVEVYGDRERLRQVMVNLIDNAIKYTDPGGSIVVGAKTVQAYCEVRVTDTGSGIPPEHLPRIFERFYRVDKNRSREVGGTGLGLAIVKHIVDAHGGTIGVTSTVGEGSSFSFTLKR